MRACNVRVLLTAAVVVVAVVGCSGGSTDDVGDPQDRELADRVLANLAAEDYAAVFTTFDADMAAAVDEAKLREVWTSATTNVGAYKSAGEPETSSDSGGTLYDYPLMFERGEQHLQVAVRAGRVAGMVLRPGKPTGEFGK